MAQNVDSKQAEGNLGLKVEGDLGDIQIIEESDDSEDGDETDTSNGRSNALSTIPSNLVNPSSTPVFGSVQITQSENVQFGNNTYFNGPVTIKQVISSQLGFDNGGYAKSDEDSIPAANGNMLSKSENIENSSFHCKLWQKVTFSALVIILLGSICGVVTVIFSKSNEDDSGTTNFSEDTSNNITVVGLCHVSYDQIFMILIILVSVIFLLVSCSSLTMEAFSSYKSRASKRRKNNTSNYKMKYNNFNMQYNYKVDPLLIAPDHLRIVSRTDWLAQPEVDKLDKIRQPVPWVIITHTATESCSTQSECVLRVRLIQMFHIESRKWIDIGYNFLVAGDGSAYYGRGWDYAGAHTLGYNKYSIAIAFIGTFNKETPPKQQIEACQKLIERGVKLGKLAKDYKLFGHRQLSSTSSPGDKLFDIIKEWPHFVQNGTDISKLIPDY